MSRVFITGQGIISSIGKNGQENSQSLARGKSGFGKLEILKTKHEDEIRVCEIKINHHDLCSLAGVPALGGFTRTSLLGILAVKEALEGAKLSPPQIQNSGFISATTTGGIRELEKYFFELLDIHQEGDFLQFVDTANPGEHAEKIAEHFSMRKFLGTISTACSSSANTIMMGAQLIRNGVLDRVVCGGAEALSKFTLNGFHSLMILDADSCRPFDQNRKGLNLGEGAAYLVLESEKEVERRKVQPLAELKGYGNANDAFQQTASSPNGQGAFLAMDKALNLAHLNPGQIHYINAHGTGTENNDISEALALSQLFDGKIPPFSSTKPFTGHTLAAAGSIEAVFCVQALEQGVMYPNLNFHQGMEEAPVVPVLEWSKGNQLHHVMSNSFGFGGNTSSLIFSKISN